MELEFEKIINIILLVVGGTADIISLLQIIAGNISWLCVILLTVTIFVVWKYNKISKCIESVADIENKLNEHISELYYVMKNSYAKHVDVDIFYELVNPKLKECVNEISEIFNQHTGKKTVATIRFFEEKFKKFDDAKVKIIAYSKDCGKDREIKFKESESKIVSENTDFRELVGTKRTIVTDYLYIGDLEKYHSELGKDNSSYDNTTKNWNEFYRAKIVVPIKFDKSRKKNRVEDIVGFLTLDTLSKNAFPKRKKIFYINLLQSYAVRLYIILDRYSYYLSKMEGERKK